MAFADDAPQRVSPTLSDGTLLVTTIQIPGEVFDRQSTLEAAGIEEGGYIRPEDTARIADAIRNLYVRRGFPETHVGVDIGETDKPGQVVLSIDIAHLEGGSLAPGPGPARLVDQRVFVIEPTFDREVGALKARYRYAKGARADESHLADADRELADLLRENGFLKAEVSHHVEDQKGTTYLFVTVQSGPRYLPYFDGNRAFDADQLRQALHLEEARELDPSALSEKLRSFYVQRGFLDVSVKLSEIGADDAPVHHLFFAVRENQRVTVAGRIFACLPTHDTTLTASELGSEIQSFLEEDLPGAEATSPVDSGIVSDLLGPQQLRGGRAAPLDLRPATTYSKETYDRAIGHLRDLVQSKGYLHAIVGPVTVLRDRCDPASPPGECLHPTRPLPQASCPVDPWGLPIAPPLPPADRTCKPDPKNHVVCAPEVTLWLPVHLGPMTTLYDLAFDGNAFFSERQLAAETNLELGQPLSNVSIDTARLAVVDAYRKRGFAFVEVRSSIEPSPDHTRARARFTIVENPQVIVTGFDVRGLVRTDRDLVLRRLALTVGQPYGLGDVRTSEERIAALGVFSSVTVSLDHPDVIEARKRVVVNVVEQLPQYIEPRIGFSTGDGVRFGFEYGHRNIAGRAVGLAVSLQLNYLFDFMILDPAVRRNYQSGNCQKDGNGEVTCGPLQVIDRLEGRGTVSISAPLASLLTASLDGLFVRDNQRDFGLTKRGLGPSLAYRATRTISGSVGVSGELNDVQLFNADTVENAIRNNPSLSSLLRVPDGTTYVIAERVQASFDRRDDPFAAKSGILVTAGAEHVDAYPTSSSTSPIDFQSHFIRLTNRVAGYVRLSKKGTSLALSLSTGYNLQLTPDDPTSKTYPDRLFFLGGVDSIRSFLADSVVPEDVAQCLIDATASASCRALRIEDVAIRGGDLMLNPRVELRVPYTDLVGFGFFLDAGNLWVDPSEVDLFALRYGLGTGVRFTTPIGPLALDYGINIDRRPWEDVGAFHFSIGLF